MQLLTLSKPDTTIVAAAGVAISKCIVIFLHIYILIYPIHNEYRLNFTSTRFFLVRQHLVLNNPTHFGEYPIHVTSIR